jgi:putative oxidoreductase
VRSSPARQEKSGAMSDWKSHALLLLRVVAGLVFWQHGLEKLFGFAGARPEATLSSIRGIGGILETVGGPLLVFGLFTRPAAFILSGEMAVAYFRAWAPRGFFPIANGGEEATLNAFIFLWLVAAGPGAWSVDAFLQRWNWRTPFDRLARLEPQFRGVLRVIVGLLLTLHGCRHLFGVLIAVAGRRNAPPLALDALPSAVGYLQLIGGVLLIAGAAVRPVSVILGAHALVAYLVFAAPRGIWPIRNGGNEALLYVAVLAYFAVAGPGAGRTFRPARPSRARRGTARQTA